MLRGAARAYHRSVTLSGFRYSPVLSPLLHRNTRSPYGVTPPQSCLSRQYVSIRDLILGIDPSTEEEADFHREFPQCKLVKGRYLSPWSRDTEKSFGDALEWLWNRRQNRLKMAGLKNYTLEGLLQPQKVDLEKLQGLSEQSTKCPHVTWIGHATCYFELEGVKFITDPVFSQRASYTQMMGPRRFFAPGIEAKDLDIDVVLLSHTHYDHLDYNSAKEIGNKALWLVPLGVKEYLEENLGITNCIEMNWWDSHNIQSNIAANPSLAQAEGITITFTPAKHWTARSIFDRNTCLWGSFAIKSSKGSVFFGGDTAYCDVFVQIAKKLGPFDLSLIPVGAYKPRYFMRDHHCDPTEAVQIHKDLQSKRSLAIHWGTFPLADEDVLEPAFELARARILANVSPSEFFTLRQGETLVLDEIVNFSAAELEGDGQGAGAGLDSLDQQQEFTTPPGDIEMLHPQLLEQYIQLVDEKAALRLARTTAKGEKGKRIKAVLDRLTTSTSSSNDKKNDRGIPN